MAPPQWMAMVCNMLIRNFQSGYVPSKAISKTKLRELADFLNEAAEQRREDNDELPDS